MENLNELKKELYAAIDTICKDFEAKHKPEPKFKVGQWVIGVYEYFPKQPKRITKIDSDMFYHEDCTDGIRWLSEDHSKIYIRLCTPEEIESHLIAEAKKRGFKTGVKAMFYKSSDIRTVNGELRYIPDWLSFAEGLVMGGDIIWRSDKGWAEIIPDKKPLPKTREEFEDFLNGWEFSSCPIRLYLDQYQF